MNTIHSFCEGRDLCPNSIKKVLPRTEARVPGSLRSVFGRTRLCPREGCFVGILGLKIYLSFGLVF